MEIAAAIGQTEVSWPPQHSTLFPSGLSKVVSCSRCTWGLLCMHVYLIWESDRNTSAMLLRWITKKYLCVIYLGFHYCPIYTHDMYDTVQKRKHSIKLKWKESVNLSFDFLLPTVHFRIRIKCIARYVYTYKEFGMRHVAQWIEPWCWDQVVTGSNPTAVSMSLCPWARHFTPNFSCGDCPQYWVCKSLWIKASNKWHVI